MDIIHPTKNNIRDLEISIQNPITLQNNHHYSNIFLGDNNLFLIQTPKLYTNGFISVINKQTQYIDLVIENDDNNEFKQWIEYLEETIRKTIFQKSNEWFSFSNSFTEDDIETFYQPVLRKNDKTIIRCYNEIKNNLNIFNNDLEKKNINDVSNKNIICIIQIKGIEFTNISFQLDLEMKQIMILDEEPIIQHKDNPFDNCLIKNTYCDNNEIYLGKNKEDNNKNTIRTKEKNEKNNNNLQEINLEYLENRNENENRVIKLKNPNQVYQKLYKEAREKAKKAKKDAVLAYLELKNIKNTYMIYDTDDENSIDDENTIDDLEDVDSISNISYEEIK